MSYSNIINRRDEYEGKDVNIKTAEVIVNEMYNSANNKNREIFFIKYKNFVQELNIIMDI